MKKGFFCLLVIAALFLVNSCRKALNDVNDYFPKTKLVSATIQTDGSVLVKGQINSAGYSAIRYLGFCCSTNPNPNMASRQIIVNSSDGINFSAVYPGSSFSVDSVYYFKSWATNTYGYAFGNSISLDSIIAPHVTPPCTITMNTVTEIEGGPSVLYTTIDTISNYTNSCSFAAQTNSSPMSVGFSFGSTLTTGIYKTTTNSPPGIGQVNISINDPFDSEVLNNGSSVYVNAIGKNTYDISICNATWSNSSGTYNFNTRLTVH